MAILRIRDPKTKAIQDVPAVRGDYGTKFIFGLVEQNETTDKYYITSLEPANTQLRPFDYIINNTDYSVWKIVDVPTKEVEATEHIWQGPVGPTGAQGIPGLPF